MTERTCERCQRPILFPLPRPDDQRHVERAVVRHAYYGCDTGCCGHEVVGLDCQGNEVFRKFEFDHPYRDDPKTFATSLADSKLRGVPLDWEQCEVSDD